MVTSPIALRSAKHTGDFKTDPLPSAHLRPAVSGHQHQCGIGANRAANRSSRDRLLGWAERTRTCRCYFEDLCCSSSAKAHNVRLINENFAQYSNGFPKMTFLSSSPLSPATQTSGRVTFHAGQNEFDDLRVAARLVLGFCVITQLAAVPIFIWVGRHRPSEA